MAKKTNKKQISMVSEKSIEKELRSMNLISTQKKRLALSFALSGLIVLGFVTGFIGGITATVQRVESRVIALQSQVDAIERQQQFELAFEGVSACPNPEYIDSLIIHSR